MNDTITPQLFRMYYVPTYLTFDTFIGERIDLRSIHSKSPIWPALTEWLYLSFAQIAFPWPGRISPWSFFQQSLSTSLTLPTSLL